MARTSVSKHFQRLAAVSALAGALAASGPVPASAQGFFDLLFGGFRRSAPPPTPSYADPRHDGRSESRRESRDEDGRRDHSGGGPGASYCVRLCDGRHFPINYRSGKSASETCRAFCPAAQTQVFSGSGISYAVAPNGKRYSDLPNAFVYRDKLVDGCTCDGKSTTGLVRLDVDDDPTLRAGDIVATDEGLMSYRGESRRSAEFTPVERASGLSPAMRKQLAATRVLPERTAEELGQARETTGVSRNVDQRSQAAR